MEPRGTSKSFRGRRNQEESLVGTQPARLCRDLYLRSNHSTTCDEPEKSEQDDRPDECDDGQSQEVGHGYTDKPRQPAAQEGPHDPHDDVPDEPKAVSGDHLTGNKAGNRSDDDEDYEVHSGETSLDRAAMTWPLRLSNKRPTPVAHPNSAVVSGPSISSPERSLTV